MCCRGLLPGFTFTRHRRQLVPFTLDGIGAGLCQMF